MLFFLFTQTENLLIKPDRVQFLQKCERQEYPKLYSWGITYSPRNSARLNYGEYNFKIN